MQVLYAQIASALVLYSLAFEIKIRNEPLNLTTIAPSPSYSAQAVEPSETGTATSTPTRFFKPRPEITAPNGFEEAPATSVLQNVAVSGRIDAPQPGIGDILQSLITATSILAMPTVHPEQSEDGRQDASQEPIRQSRLHPPHLEASQDGFVQATTAANPHNNQPQATSPPARPDPPPAIMVGGVTVQPTPVTSAQVFVVGDKTMTTPVVDFQYVVGSSLLSVGRPTTVNGVVVALNVNSAGSTVLVAGDMTTTLPAPIQNVQAAQATQPAQISTAVVDGTTKYLIAGQTLAPGQAVTIGGIPVSFSAKDGTTVLVMGSSTTTLVATTGVKTTANWGASAVATPGNGDNRNSPATTSAKGGADAMRYPNRLLAFFAGVFGVCLPLI